MDTIAFWSIEIRIQGKQVDFNNLDSMARKDILSEIKAGKTRGHVYTKELKKEEI